MNEGSRGLREVVPAQCHAPHLREFTVATGAAAQTLQDIKLPDSAGLCQVLGTLNTQFPVSCQEATVTKMIPTALC